MNPLTSATTSIALADPNEMCRAGMRAWIEAIPACVLEAEASTSDDAIRIASTLCPGILLVDTILVPDELIAGIQRLLHCSPATRTLLLVHRFDRTVERAAIDAGFSGCLSKNCRRQSFVQAIETLRAGRVFHDIDAASEDAGRVGPLTAREHEVLRDMARGVAAKQIAARLAISMRTVEFHKYRGQRKLGIVTRSDLLRHGLRAGWFSDWY